MKLEAPTSSFFFRFLHFRIQATYKSMKKAVIVTGASSGIGKATAQLFASHGYFVFLAARNEQRLIEVAEHCSAGASLLKIDFEKEETIRKYAQHIFERKDVRLLSLVNNAGIFSAEMFASSDLTGWKKMMQVNLFGPQLLTQIVLKELIRNQGSIVNVSSTLGRKPTPQTGAYSASKAAMNSWTQSLAAELGPHGVRVNAVLPGIVDTPIHSFYSSPEKDKIVEQMKKLQPLGRIGTPEEIAQSIYFLASSQSSWTTGTLMDVDGGISLT
jgi:NAD(P)-dependent dehydrogenase (short-subunit alcohol dehydrogenase family)